MPFESTAERVPRSAAVKPSPLVRADSRLTSIRPLMTTDDCALAVLPARAVATATATVLSTLFMESPLKTLPKA